MNAHFIIYICALLLALAQKVSIRQIVKAWNHPKWTRQNPSARRQEKRSFNVDV